LEEFSTVGIKDLEIGIEADQPNVGHLSGLGGRLFHGNMIRQSDFLCRQEPKQL